MTERKIIGCVIAVLGTFLFCVTLPLGVIGVAWLIYDLARWGHIPYWLPSISGISLALCLPSLAILVILGGLLVYLLSPRHRR